jgi:hypothetical protein
VAYKSFTELVLGGVRELLCSNLGCPRPVYIQMAEFKMDGTPNKFANRLYCKECWDKGVFESMEDTKTRFPEGAEL